MIVKPNTHVVTVPKLHVPAGDTDAVITMAAAEKVINVVDSVHCSYDAAPTGGKLTITVDAATKFEVDITAAGPLEFLFPGGLYGSENQAVVITLAAAGGAIVGKVNAQTR